MYRKAVASTPTDRSWKNGDYRAASANKYPNYYESKFSQSANINFGKNSSYLGGRDSSFLSRDKDAYASPFDSSFDPKVPDYSYDKSGYRLATEASMQDRRIPTTYK